MKTMRQNCRVLRTFDSTPISTLELFCGKCGSKVGITAGETVSFSMQCAECGCGLDADTTLAREIGERFTEQISDDERQTVFARYFDRLVDVDGKSGREKSQDLADRLEIEWSVYDPLFRRRVNDIQTTSRGSDVKRTQWIYTDADNDENPHLYHSELGFYFYRGFVPFWAQEEIALSCGLDGHSQLASYYIVQKEHEYLEAKGLDIPADDLDFLEWVCERHDLKFDPLEVRHNIRLVESNLDAISDKEDELREQWIRDMVFQYYQTNEFTLESADGKEVTIENIQEILSFLDDETEQAIRDELEEKNFLWMLDHQQAEWFDARYSPTFPSLQEAENWVTLLQKRFEIEWDATLDAARNAAESPANHPSKTTLSA